MLLSGQFALRMDDGQEVILQPMDIADIPPGHDAWVVGDEPVVIIDIAGNIGSIAVPQAHERILATMLFTDIVGSTSTAERLGDAAWKQLLADHHRVIRSQLDRFRGTEVDTTGDGFLATFSSAANALRCAIDIRDAIRAIGLEVRIGVHAGEVELVGSQIAGVNVHAAARIMSLAGPSQSWPRRSFAVSPTAVAWRSLSSASMRSRGWSGRSRSSSCSGERLAGADSHDPRSSRRWVFLGPRNSG